MSVTLLLGLDKVRTGARASFSNNISDTDLIVGARSGAIQLLLYSVFQIGDATANITWQTIEDLAARPEVAWIVPLSLDDSHHGFGVLGTTQAILRSVGARPRTILGLLVAEAGILTATGATVGAHAALRAADRAAATDRRPVRPVHRDPATRGARACDARTDG